MIRSSRTSSEARAACALFGIDPYWTLSEGTLIVTVRPGQAEALLHALAEGNITAADAGEVVRGNGTLWLTGLDGSVEKWTEPLPDPYWQAYETAVREEWS